MYPVCPNDSNSGIQIDTVALTVLCQVFQLFRRKRISMGHKIKNRTEAHCTPLVVRQPELECIKFPVRAELNHTLIVGNGFRDATGVYHETAHFSPARSFPRI